MKTLTGLVLTALILLPVLIFSLDKNVKLSTQSSLYLSRKVIICRKAHDAIGPFTQRIVAGNFLFTSGKLPINPVTGFITLTIEK